ncbi:ribonuclease Trv [Xylogone sp. PMI_703]|nr:ribonuclease Trv [Xylogone sp. PMI_703]
MAPPSAFLLPLAFAATAAASCNADNCLRALRATARIDDARAFCATFTTESVTATTGIPSYAVAGCTGNVASRVSSACSCIATSSPATTTTTTSATTLATSTTTSSAAPTSTYVPPGPKVCLNPQLSCQNVTQVQDLCCFNAPGGQLLQTQFWDTNPSTGPSDSWTIHGLWPDHCDGTFDQNCDPTRAFTNITAILQSYNRTDLLTYMNKYWKDINGNDEGFWEHEWGKHGTCMSTLEPSCYNDYQPQEEVVDFFERTISLFTQLDSYTFLKNAGIVPSNTVTYTFDQIQSALTAAHGFPVTISCSGGALNEIWYHFDVRGSVQTGEFVATVPDGSKSNCADTGIKYIPKYQTTSTTTSSGTASPTSTPTPFQGKGFLQAYLNGQNTGCLISAGTWYTTGTCATYTATTSGDGFTLKSSKGPCDIINDVFSCAAGNTAGVFSQLDGLLAYGDSAEFFAAAVPTGIVQQKVSTTTNAVEVSFAWQSLP